MVHTAPVVDIPLIPGWLAQSTSPSLLPSRHDSTGYGSSYRRDSGASRYPDYSSSRYTSTAGSKYDSPRSFDYTSSRYGDPDRFSKYRQTSKDLVAESKTGNYIINVEKNSNKQSISESYDEAPPILSEPPAEEEHQGEWYGFQNAGLGSVLWHFAVTFKQNFQQLFTQQSLSLGLLILPRKKRGTL